MPHYVAYQKNVVYAFIKLSAKSHSSVLTFRAQWMGSAALLYMSLYLVPWGNDYEFADCFEEQLKGPYADHILIPQGSTGSSIFFDVK